MSILAQFFNLHFVLLPLRANEESVPARRSVYLG
jgi:hypothetical protein